MPGLLKIFLVGMLVSFLGSLPLGTLNIAAMQISVSDGIRAALLFSIGSLLAEIIYVRLSLVAMDWIRKQERILKILEWVTLGIVVALAAASFYAALHPSQEKNVILSSNLPKVLLGFTMSALNPVQIPFWFGWSTVLFTKKVLLPRNDHYNLTLNCFLSEIIMHFLQCAPCVFFKHFCEFPTNTTWPVFAKILDQVFQCFYQTHGRLVKNDGTFFFRQLGE